MIQNPEEDILQASPAFQNKVLALRQQIADKEAEIQRLNKEIISLSYTVDQLTLQKQELDGFVNDGEFKKIKLKEELKELAETEATLRESVKQSEDFLKAHRIEIENNAKTIAEAQSGLKASEQAHSLKVKEVLDKEAELEIKEKALNEKISKLKEIIQ